MQPGAGDRPEITYPCEWGYRIIGTSEEEIRRVVREVVGEAEHTLAVSNESSGGKYVSLHLALTVTDEAHRLDVYRRIREAECVKIVL